MWNNQFLYGVLLSLCFVGCQIVETASTDEMVEAERKVAISEGEVTEFKKCKGAVIAGVRFSNESMENSVFSKNFVHGILSELDLPLSGWEIKGLSKEEFDKSLQKIEGQFDKFPADIQKRFPESFGQLFAIKIGGKQIVVGNFFPKIFEKRNPTVIYGSLVIVADGGNNFFRLIFDFSESEKIVTQVNTSKVNPVSGTH